MERCGSRRSEALPRLQVIGFNVSPPIIKGAEAAPAAASRESSDLASSTAASWNELPISPSHLSKPATSSPRSALQQLLLHQSLPSTSPTSSNHSLPPLQPSPNQNSKLGLLQPDHPSSLGAAANHNRPSVLGTLLQSFTSDPSPANQKSTSGISKLKSPPSAYQSGRPRCLVQSELVTSDVSANQSFHTSFFRLKSQLQYDNSSASSGDSQAIGQCDVKPAKAVIKESYGAIFQIEKAGDDKNVAKAHEAIKSAWLSSKSNHSHAAKSRKSSWLPTDGNDSDDADDDDYADDYVEDAHPSAAERICKKSSLLDPGVQSSTKHSPDNEKNRNSNRYEEKSKKSSLLFVVSSPASDYPHQRHSAEHKSSKAMDFLSSCHLCRCPLGPDQDVFMYSGDKAFCSMECRYQQIIIDERKERRPPSIIRSGASPELHRTSVPVTATHRPMMNNKPYFINTAAVA